MDSPAAPSRKKLPIGLQTLTKLREQGCYYVDKSGLAVDLIDSGSAFFLSRPRRFGKSLLVDTFKELFEGNRTVFQGLAAESRWDWSRRYPVIRISFAGGGLSSLERLEQRIIEILDENAQRLGVSCLHHSVTGRLVELVQKARVRHGAPVVVLVDEYDKPMLDALEDPALALQMRQGLKALYESLKYVDEDLRFVFLTGVSKFSKVSLFSGLNQLIDITLEPAWSALCGYSDTELDQVFAPELLDLDREEIRRWYNGYNWGGTAVYNPFDVLLLFRNRVFRPYWFETGTPTFLVHLLAQQQFFTPDLNQLHSDASLLSNFDVDHIQPEALLFQAGYLTLQSVTPASPIQESIFTLGYPNREVEVSLNRVLLQGYGVPERAAFQSRMTLHQALREAHMAGIETALRALFAGIPSDWYRRNPLARFEGHYASVFYSHLAGLGLRVQVEDATSHGRIDVSVLCPDRVFLFEFKVVPAEAQGHALRQIQARGYADKYRANGVPIHLIGVEFSQQARNLVGFEVQTDAPS